ncbi:MAG: hypothetical protein ACK452_13105, partial [Bacteroidota bacterium]
MENIWSNASKKNKKEFWSLETIKNAFNDNVLLSFPQIKNQISINVNQGKSRNDLLKDFTEIKLLEKNYQPFLQKIIYNRSLILYAQRHFIENYFKETQYDLEDTALPFDWDHISPNKYVSKKKKIPSFVRDWYQTNGNFRAWPYALNRMDGDNYPSLKLNPLKSPSKEKED